MLAALADLRSDLGRQLILASAIAGVLEPLVLLETDDHGRGRAVVGEDGFLPGLIVLVARSLVDVVVADG
jgi:hypothetical protein